MKKTFYTLVLGFLSITAFSYRIQAQNSAGPIAFYETKNFHSSIRHVADFTKRVSMLNDRKDEKGLNSKAVKDFQSRFQKVDNATWYSDNDGLISYFSRNNFINKVFYDKKGNWQFSVILYNQDQLPADLRIAVKTKFYDLAITLIEEVSSNDGMVYIVHLEDKSNIKIVRLNNNAEMEIMEEITRS